MKIKSEKVVHNSKRFKVIEQVIADEDIVKTKEIIEMGSGIAFVALDDRENVWMIREWRSAFNDYVTQIPGGYCGSNEENKLLETVETEAREELGITKIGHTQKLRTYYPSGAIRTKIHVYLLTGIKITSPAKLEKNERLHVFSLPLTEAYERFVVGNELTTSATIIGLTCAKELLKRESLK